MGAWDDQTSDRRVQAWTSDSGSLTRSGFLRGCAGIRSDAVRLVADAGSRGYNAPLPYGLRIYTSGQKRTECLPTLARHSLNVKPSAQPA